MLFDVRPGVSKIFLRGNFYLTFQHQLAKNSLDVPWLILLRRFCMEIFRILPFSRVQVIFVCSTPSDK